MSRNFNGSSDYMEQTAVPITAYPLTLAGWVNPANTSQDGTIIGLAGGAADCAFAIRIESSSGAVIGAIADNNPNVGDAFSTSSYVANSWQHACGVFYSNTSRASFLNGANKGTDSTNCPFNGSVSVVDIGNINFAATRFDFLPGSIAEAAIWNVALTDAEVASLAKGFSPLLVRPQNLVFYTPLVRDVKNVKGGGSIVVNGTTVAPHPRVFA